MAAGHEHGLALRNDATVWSWGDNAGGDLGWGFPGKGVEPGQISGLSNVTAVAAGEQDSFALLSNGTVKAWGANRAGQLGDGTTEDKHQPVTVSGLEGVKAIAAGNTHALALLNDGTVKAWGANYCGQLGNGSTTDSHVPVTVGGLSGATAIAGGGSDSYALLSNGVIKSWGQNSNGETGDGDNGGSGTCTGGSPADLTPVSVSGVSTATAIAAGSSFAYALLANRTVVAWGNNNPGDIGDETDEGPERCLFETELGKYNEACSKSPVEVSTVHGVRAIGAGGGTGYATGSGPVSTPTIEEQLGPENPGEPGQQRACEGKPVNCATGNETTSETDLAVGGRGIPLGLTRTYNAQAAATQSTPDLFGYGWSATFTEHLIVNPTEGTDTVVQANGSTVAFKRTGTPGEQTAPAWAQAKLVLNSDGTYTYTLPSHEPPWVPRRPFL